MEICVTFLLFPDFLFQIFSHDFIIYIEAATWVASNTASDDATN